MGFVEYWKFKHGKFWLAGLLFLIFTGIITQAINLSANILIGYQKIMPMWLWGLIIVIFVIIILMVVPWIYGRIIGWVYEEIIYKK